MASVTVDIDLDEFDDDEVLARAAEIVRQSKKSPRANPALADELLNLRAAMFEEAPGEVSELSTAARLTGFHSLKKLVAEHPELYRFAGAPQ